MPGKTAAELTLTPRRLTRLQRSHEVEPATGDLAGARHLTDATHVRQLAGGVDRATLARWRKSSPRGHRPFPTPVPAPLVSWEVWDAREVIAWIRDKP